MLGGLSFAVVDQEDLAGFFRKIVDQVGHDGFFLLPAETVRMVRGRVGDHGEDVVHVAIDALLAVLAAQVVMREVARDLAQPGQEAGLVAQPGQVVPGAEEGVLRDVLAGRRG